MFDAAMFVITGLTGFTVQFCVSAGLLFCVPQLFKSVHVLVCVPFTHWLQSVQLQFSWHGWQSLSFAEVQLLGQHPSPLVQDVIGALEHTPFRQLSIVQGFWSLHTVGAKTQPVRGLHESWVHAFESLHVIGV